MEAIWIEQNAIRMEQKGTKLTKEEDFCCKVDPVVCFDVFPPFVTFLPFCSIPRSWAFPNGSVCSGGNFVPVLPVLRFQLFGCLLFFDFVPVDPKERVVFFVLVFPQLFRRFIGGC